MGIIILACSETVKAETRNQFKTEINIRPYDDDSAITIKENRSNFSVLQGESITLN